MGWGSASCRVPSFCYVLFQRGAMPMRPVHTYSIVARDPATGQLGVAVQSHYFSVGSVVPWVEPGVGAIAMQSYLHLAFGPEALPSCAPANQRRKPWPSSSPAIPNRIFGRWPWSTRTATSPPHGHTVYRSSRAHRRRRILGPGQPDAQRRCLAGYGPCLRDGQRRSGRPADDSARGGRGGWR